jgi:hypothetical protein
MFGTAWRVGRPPRMLAVAVAVVAGGATGSTHGNPKAW